MKNINAHYLPEADGLSGRELQNLVAETVGAHPVSCVNWSEYPYAPEVSVRVAFTDKALVVMFEVEEENVRAVATENNGPVWEDSCVEVFLANPVGEGYFNFEINCIGTKLAARRTSRHDAEHFGPEKMEKIICHTSLPHEPIDAENGRWSLVEVIPFELIGLDSAPSSLRANFYKCGDKCRTPHFLSWSPIGLPSPDFHCPQFFGELTLPLSFRA